VRSLSGNTSGNRKRIVQGSEHVEQSRVEDLIMAEQNAVADEILLDIKVADASKLYKFYLNQEQKILGAVAVILFLTLWSSWAGR
jgi:hypothetical protein